jgi:hypothetical protein
MRSQQGAVVCEGCGWISRRTRRPGPAPWGRCSKCEAVLIERKHRRTPTEMPTTAIIGNLLKDHKDGVKCPSCGWSGNRVKRFQPKPYGVCPKCATPVERRQPKPRRSPALTTKIVVTMTAEEARAIITGKQHAWKRFRSTLRQIVKKAMLDAEHGKLPVVVVWEPPPPTPRMDHQVGVKVRIR